MSSKVVTNSKPERSIIVPVYRNSDQLESLIERLRNASLRSEHATEVVFVVDGCPDDGHAKLLQQLPTSGLNSQLLNLSRNFGSFAAIREGLAAAKGQFMAIMAADLQEPAELVHEMFEQLTQNRADVVIGTRINRKDPVAGKFFSGIFWRLQKRFVQSDMPVGGLDVFGCNQLFRDHLLSFQETHSSLIGQLFWLGFRRLEIPYRRQARLSGKSAWSWSRKQKYFFDSLFSFTDLPIRFFTLMGMVGLFASVLLGILVLAARLTGQIEVPGYTATVLTIVFFAGLNLLGIGIIGNYVWRAYENTKHRPLAVVMSKHHFPDSTSS